MSYSRSTRYEGQLSFFLFLRQWAKMFSFALGLHAQANIAETAGIVIEIRPGYRLGIFRPPCRNTCPIAPVVIDPTGGVFLPSFTLPFHLALGGILSVRPWPLF